MNKYNVLIEAKPFCRVNESPLKRLKDEKLEIFDMRGLGIESREFRQVLKKANTIICGNELQINEALLRNAPNVEIIIKLGTGIDNIDFTAATKHGILVCDTRGVNKNAVADHTFALILSVARKIVQCDRGIRKGKWEQTKYLCPDVWQQTLGLIGIGSIGQSVAFRARGFDMKIVAFDPHWPHAFAREMQIERVTLNHLLEISDFISLHLPLTPETKGLIDHRAFKRMKSNAIIVNTSRGGILHEPDLYIALKNGVIAGAGIDVFTDEPPTHSPLLELDNVVATPHNSAFTYNALHGMDIAVVEQLLLFLKGEIPKNAINGKVLPKVVEAKTW